MYVEFYNLSHDEAFYLTGTREVMQVEASNTLRSNNAHNTIDAEQLLYLADTVSGMEHLENKQLQAEFVALADLYPGDSFQVRFFRLRPDHPVMTKRCETVGAYWPVYNRRNNSYTFQPVK